MTHDDTVWQGGDLTAAYLEGVRGAFPLAAEQIALMLRVIGAARPTVYRILDLGCGDGILGRAILGRWPAAAAVFLDFSAPMLEAAQAHFDGMAHRHSFLAVDYGDPAWLEAVRPQAPFDAIVSGFSIHHQPDDRKRSLYAELFDLLAPGGVFLNLEHVASATPWVASLFDDLMVDAQYEHQRASGSGKSRQQVADAYCYRPDKDANILAPVEAQCEWLRAIGFREVDCYLKILELALFGGLKPAKT